MSLLSRLSTSEVQNNAQRGTIIQELIRRWDSKRQLFYDDMARTYFKILKREPTSFNQLDDS